MLDIQRHRMPLAMVKGGQLPRMFSAAASLWIGAGCWRWILSAQPWDGIQSTRHWRRGVVNLSGPNSSSVSVAPAVEYNWSGSRSIIAGLDFSAAGRNTPSYIAPPIALAMAF